MPLLGKAARHGQSTGGAEGGDEGGGKGGGEGGPGGANEAVDPHVTKQEAAQ
jgi:hypothetical protein